MKRFLALFLMVSVLSTGLCACSAHQSTTNQVQKAGNMLKVARQAIVTAAQAVEEAHREGILGETKYLEMRNIVLLASGKYNLALEYYRMTRSVVAGDVEAIISMVEAVVAAIGNARVEGGSQ